MHALAAPSLDPFDTLNDAQRLAVEHGLDGDPTQAAPLLVIAGAGSGKTKTLAARVARLVLAGADPQRLLLLTFSRRAAAEMTQRVGAQLQLALGLAPGSRAPVLPWAGTFHGIGARLVRDYARHIGLSESFTILDRGDAEDLMAQVREALGFAKARSRFPLKGTCLSIYSRLINSQAALHPLLLEHYPWCCNWTDELERLFEAYVARKRDEQVLDYDDLLLYWSRMMEAPELAAHVGQRFDHVLVDEYQDTNRLQAAILRALKPTGRGLTVVGDDAQSIYSFRAAEVRNILDFPHGFATPARLVTLERNYRSTQPILAASNAVIALAEERFSKALWSDRPSSEKPRLVSVDDEAAQARWVADQVLEHREMGIRLKSQAVLFRSSSHSAALELELARRNIPFVKFGGLKFLEAAHIKDVLSVLRWVHNPRHRLAGFRVAQLVAGIGPATARRLLDAMDAAADPAEALLAFEPPGAAAADWASLRELYRRLREGEAGWPQEVASVQQWYEPQLERLHDEPRARLADLAQLAQLARGYASRERFLTELTLDPPEATSDEAGTPLLDEDYLILSTIHSAKGQEWQSVHLLNVVDGCMPADLSAGTAAQLAEERRLLYVAMTRAKRHLHLLVPQRFYLTQQAGGGDKHVYGALTRFIPPSIAGAFERVTGSNRGDASAPVALAAPAVAVDLGFRRGP
ncbi:ATP-dependent helicase [Caldimonas sp. KR1-144]|uniref:ATP-dependent helicase n=1 Tax=Caldimonas sp. KR1-144 TaxID=3400911 RepID=UPI003C1274C3